MSEENKELIENEEGQVNVFRGEERDWSPQYAAIGEFLVAFEWICFELRFLINSILQFHGLNKWKLGEIILNLRVFTAEPLLTCLDGVVGELFPGNTDIMGKMSAFRSAFSNLSKTRNDILHATWIIGPTVVEVTGAPQPTELHAEKRTPNKSGSRVTVLAENIEDVKTRTAEALRVRELFAELRSAITISLAREAYPEKFDKERE